MADRGWYSKSTHPLRVCVICGSSYEPKGPTSKICSKDCRKSYVLLKRWNATERQYDKISGNWDRYFSRLLSKKGRQSLSVPDLKFLLEKQNGKCAITGVALTCILEKGKICRTNASIDRIIAGGSYTIDNVQLVCAAVNKLRCDMDMKEYIDWCKKVVNSSRKKRK